MLTRLKLGNFKNFHSEEVQVSPFTLLVGVNASGKSNFFDAIRLLQGIGQGYSFSDILNGRYEGGVAVWRGIRGAANEIALDPSSPVLIESDWLIEGESFTHAIEFVLADEVSLASEKLNWNTRNTYLFDTHAPSLGGGAGPVQGGAINVAFKRAPGGSGGRSPSAVFPADRSILSRRLTIKNVHDKVVSASEKLTAAISGALFLDLQPGLMREFRSTRIRSLGLNGENISPALYHLCRDEAEKSAVVDWLSELCSPEVSDIDFVQTEFEQVMFVLVEKGGRRVSAKSVSDGTLRFLGQLVALRTAPSGTLLLVEELENGLHPSRQVLLVEAMESFVESNYIQVVASTHSPILLESVKRPVLEHAVIFARNGNDDSSVMREFRNVPYFQETATKSNIGDLFSTLWIERAL